MSGSKGKKPKGVLSKALLEASALQEQIAPGRKAMGTYASRIDERSATVTDSLDLDAATQASHPNAHRWDYVLGVSAEPAATGALVAVEVHSATDGEVSVVIEKKRSSKPVLQAELRAGRTVSRWCWIASGNVRFSPNSKHRRLLAQAAIEFCGRTLSL